MRDACIGFNAHIEALLGCWAYAARQLVGSRARALLVARDLPPVHAGLQSCNLQPTTYAFYLPVLQLAQSVHIHVGTADAVGAAGCSACA